MSSRPVVVAAPRQLTKLPSRRISPVKAPGRASSSLTALIEGMEAIGAPAFVVDESGLVLHANSSGRSLLARDPASTAPLLPRSVVEASNDLGWERIPLSADDGSQRFLTIRSASPRVVPSVCVQAASARWKLTRRQAQVLGLVARGLTNADVAAELAIRVTTVEFHVAAIFDKAGVDNRATLIARLHDTPSTAP